MDQQLEMTVTLNGTDHNMWHRYNLKQNPFPQLAIASMYQGEMQINSLNGDPIKGPDDIRERLKGFDKEFVDGVIERFVPGQRVSFIVTFPRDRA